MRLNSVKQNYGGKCPLPLTQNAMAKSSKGGKISNKELRRRVREFVATQGNNTFNYKQVSQAIKATSPMHQRAVALLLAALAFDGELVKLLGVLVRQGARQ